MNRLFFILGGILLSTHVTAQKQQDTLVLELSPAMLSLNENTNFTVQGRVTYKFGRYFEMSARHNHTIFSGGVKPESLNPDPYRKSTLSNLQLSVNLLNSRQISYPNISSYTAKTYRPFELFLDLGMVYSRFGTYRTNYYTFDTTSSGEYRIIKAKNIISAAFGLSFRLSNYSGPNPGSVHIIRQHTVSLGLLHGLKYDLEGFIKTAGNPEDNPPENYGFRRDGFYLGYNFQQQLNQHFFIGFESLFYRTPYVQYYPNPDLFIFRGGEAEFALKIYGGITIGYRM